MKRSTLSILIIAIAALQSCYKNNAYDTANRDIGNLFQISVDKDSVLADGSSLIEIKISGLPEKISDTDNKASLETDNGLFDANGTKNIDISSSLVFANNSYTRVATTKLKAESKVKVATIKVTMKAVAKTYIVRFYKAPPERVKITPSLIFFTPSFTNPVTFEVALTRSFGIPTQETSITVQVTNLNGAVVGTFSRYDNLSGPDGKCNFTYFFTDTSYHNLLKCKVTVDQLIPVLADSVNIRSL